jgi:predicted NAD/FAD-binding protein
MRLGRAVTSIRRTAHGVVVEDSFGHSDTYDHIVIATHSDQALDMLTDADANERSVLGDIRYAPNIVYLHRDPRLMPMRKNAWASWNFLRWKRDGAAVNDVAVTYWMNPLQGLDSSRPLFVSLNPPFAPDPDLTFGRYLCDHPQYDTAAFAAQKRLGEIQGKRRTWFAERGPATAFTRTDCGLDLPWPMPLAHRRRGMSARKNSARRRSNPCGT